MVLIRPTTCIHKPDDEVSVTCQNALRSVGTIKHSQKSDDSQCHPTPRRYVRVKSTQSRSYQQGFNVINVTIKQFFFLVYSVALCSC